MRDATSVTENVTVFHLETMTFLEGTLTSR